MNLLLIQGNALMMGLADESIHCCVTSPPYWNLRDYGTATWDGGDPECDHIAKLGRNDYETIPRPKGGHREGSQPKPMQYKNVCGKCGAIRIDNQLGLEPTPEQFVANMVAVFREVKRVLRPDGTCWINLGDAYFSSGIKKDGGHGFVDGGKVKLEKAKGSNLGGYIAPHDSLKPKDLCGIPWRVAFALQADGWWLRSDIIWSKPNPMPESVTDRPTKAHEYLFLLTKSARYYYDADAVRENHKYQAIDAKRHDYNKPSPTVDKHLEVGQVGKTRHGRKRSEDYHPSGRNRRTVWHIDNKLDEFLNFAVSQGIDIEALVEAYLDGQSAKKDTWHIATAPYSGAHFATYPPALVEPCIKAGTSERGVCPECGAPWERVVEKSTRFEGGSGKAGTKAEDIKGKWGDKRYGENILLGPVVDVQTLGWRPTCDHYPHTDRWREFPSQGEMTDVEYYWSTLNIRLERKILVEFWRRFDSVPAKVFDPFGGSMTTLQVARALGRNGIGLDLSLEYLHLARQRLSLDALDAWGKAKTPGLSAQGQEDGKTVTDLPMFGGQDE